MVGEYHEKIRGLNFPYDLYHLYKVARIKFPMVTTSVPFPEFCKKYGDICLIIFLVNYARSLLLQFTASTV